MWKKKFKKLAAAVAVVSALSVEMTAFAAGNLNLIYSGPVLAMPGGSEAFDAALQPGQEDAMEITPGYYSVTEAMDWGPAVTKVVLNMGVTLNGACLDNGTFVVSSERKYPGLKFATNKRKAVDDIVGRPVTGAYVSDQAGNPNPAGTYVTLELLCGPDKTEGSPFIYDSAKGVNTYVEMNHIISVAPGKSLVTADGKAVVMKEAGAAQNLGNVNLLGDLFDRTGSYTDSARGITLNYASYVPDKNAQAGSTPLIIWLHGAGEGGTDPTIAIMGNKVVNLATAGIQKYFGSTGAGILVPQTSTMWMDGGDGKYMNPLDRTKGRSCYTDTLMELIKAYVAAHPEIDAKRIYIGGCSNGGYMTVNMLVSYPDYFAAAYPVCEAYANNWMKDADIAAIKDIPIWLTAAKSDGVVKLYKGKMESDFSYTFALDAGGNRIPLNNYSNALYSRLQAAGAKDVHYSLFENVVDTSGKYFKADGVTPYEYRGHLSWIYTLNNECVEEIGGVQTTIFEWMAKQSK